MRGGKREGAGRKASEATIRVSVPVGVLDKVQALVTSYRQAQQQPIEADAIIEKLAELKIRQKIKQAATKAPRLEAEPHLNICQEIKTGTIAKTDTNEAKPTDTLPSLPPSKEPDRTIGQPPAINNADEIKWAMSALERLSTIDRKILKKSFGSLYNAAKLGVKAKGKSFYVPEEIRHRLKAPTNRTFSGQ